NFLAINLSRYYINISGVTQSSSNEELMGSLHNVTNDIERLGDYAIILLKGTSDMKENDWEFLDQTKEELSEIYELISHMFDLMFDLGFDAFKTRDTEHFSEIAELQKKIEKLISFARNEHVVRLNSGEYPVGVSKTLYAILFSFERMSGHI